MIAVSQDRDILRDCDFCCVREGQAMSVTCTGEGREWTAVLTGEVDHHHARSIMAELEQAVDTGLPRRLTLDLSGVTFMDSSGIAVLLRAYKRLRELGGTVRVIQVPPQARKVLRTAGLERLMAFE